MRVGPGCLFWIAVSVILSVVLTVLLNLPFLLSGYSHDRNRLAGRKPMIGWGRGNRRGCCVVVPVGCLTTLALILLLSGLAVAKLL